MKKKLSRLDLVKMKEARQKLAWVTAYDYWTAQFAEKAGMDMLLVGDSLGMCIYGYEGTIPVTMDQCICLPRRCRGALPTPSSSATCPFISYQVNTDEAASERGALLRSGHGRDEAGGRPRVCATDQSHRRRGDACHGPHRSDTAELRPAGRIQGAGEDGRMRPWNSSRTPPPSRRPARSRCWWKRSRRRWAGLSASCLKIPVYSIGAGRACRRAAADRERPPGVFQAFTPKFVKKYADLAGTIQKALGDYAGDVREKRFPQEEHAYQMVEGEYQKLEEALRKISERGG